MNRRWSVLIASGLLMSVLAAERAAAHDTDIYGWGNCSYADRTDLGINLAVGYDPSYAFPANGFGDGVVNSFTDRISDAANVRWGSAMLNYTAGRLVYIGGHPASDVLIRYTDFVAGNGSTFGATDHIVQGGGVCGNVHTGTPDLHIFQTIIQMDVRTDWFTQDDTRRAYWEGCPGRGYVTAYTCAKFTDFGSGITHELGHAMRIHHPNEVDSHAPGGNSAMASANCASFVTYATMCPSILGGYHTAWRTLDVWDNESLRRQYEENT